MQIEYADLFPLLAGTPLDSWQRDLPALLTERLHPAQQGDLPRWTAALAQLPPFDDSSRIDLKTEVRIDGSEIPSLSRLLMTFHPWRKGPFSIHGIYLDTEWRSDWKWQRILPHIKSLQGARVLDVGCGNGYHCWRMAGEGAELVIGIDPSLLYVCQFFALKNFIHDSRVWVLPLSLEQLPVASAFDQIFSLGVLYHRKSPLDHLEQLRSFLAPGGELVLETLIVDGKEGYALLPRGRYAKMRNVWFIPTLATLTLWLRRCGFRQVRTVDVSLTTVEEQRSTSWMTFESLGDFLDPSDRSKTIEGYPAPCRAVVVASK